MAVLPVDAAGGEATLVVACDSGCPCTAAVMLEPQPQRAVRTHVGAAAGDIASVVGLPIAVNRVFDWEVRPQRATRQRRRDVPEAGAWLPQGQWATVLDGPAVPGSSRLWVFDHQDSEGDYWGEDSEDEPVAGPDPAPSEAEVAAAVEAEADYAAADAEANRSHFARVKAEVAAEVGAEADSAADAEANRNHFLRHPHLC